MHRKITGDFGENLVLYWLSKYGFECARVDHTGIDLIARNKKTNEVMGISVKSRCRNTGTEGTFVSIKKDNFSKAEIACRAFGCIPYFAIVVDEGEEIKMFILSMEHLLQLFPIRKTTSAWKMTDKYIENYMKDPKIQKVIFKHKTIKWW
jgi:Holliday junction resolvase-like predicted endonuclease